MKMTTTHFLGCLFVEGFTKISGFDIPYFWTPRGDLDPLIPKATCLRYKLGSPSIIFGWEDPIFSETECAGWAGICNAGTGDETENALTVPPVSSQKIGTCDDVVGIQQEVSR